MSVISASYYLKIIKEIYYESITDNKDNEISPNPNHNNFSYQGQFYGRAEEYTLSNLHSYVISILTLFILFFILKPFLVLNYTFWVVSTIFPIN